MQHRHHISTAELVAIFHWFVTYQPLKVVLEIYDFLGVGHKCCKIGPQLFPTTLHLGIYISNLCHFQLKTWSKQLLYYVPLDIALHGSADWSN
jgi:hypothetical protein